MNATKKMASYIKAKGVSIKAIAAATKLSTGVLYPSLQVRSARRTRPLRVDEFLAICAFLEVDPLEFKTEVPKEKV